MIELRNIPVLAKTPVRGLALNTLVVEAKLTSAIYVPNGAFIGFLITYSPGSYTDLGTFVRVYDVIIVPYGTVCVSVWGNRTNPVLSEDVLSQNLQYVARRPYDFLLIIFDLRRPPTPPVSLVDEISGIRASLIATNALIID